MWRILLVLVVLPFVACGGDDTPVDIGWGLTCPGGRYAPMGITPGEGPAARHTPEEALDRFLNAEMPDGSPSRGPGASLPKDGYELADFILTRDGTAPVTATLMVDDQAVPGPHLAFVHRDGEHIDVVIVLSFVPFVGPQGGWVVDAVHRCGER